RISLFSIGGGYNMIPLMQHEVAANGWLTSARFLDVLAVSEITPGPIAVNLATFAGYHVAGVPGSIAATVGVCLPGALFLLALGALALHLRERPAFRAAMRGLMPALVGLLAATAIRLGFALVPAGASFPGLPAILIFAAAFGLVLWKNPHPALLMLGAAGAGIALSAF
ncbi:MAG: chromate transporter, partial [Kiritimatiellia bacterium]